MNFQDSLKTSAKTKDEVANEEQNRKRQQDLSVVDKCVKQIEQGLLNKAKHGKYEAIEGENIVECKFHDYDCARFLDKSTNLHTPLGAEMEILIQIKERFDFFISTLKERLDEEDIIIVKHYLAYVVSKTYIIPENHYPAVIDNFRDSKALSNEKKLSIAGRPFRRNVARDLFSLIKIKVAEANSIPMLILKEYSA